MDVPTPDPTVVAATKPEDYHLAPANGIYESFFEVGDQVEQGQPIGQIHFPQRFDQEPEVVRAANSGLLICRRFPGGTEQGDCVAVIARPVAVP
jgi:predicted deacylase